MLVFFALSAAVGCVPKGKYDELYAAKMAVDDEAAALREELEGLYKQISRKNTQIDALHDSLDASNAKLSDATQETRSLTADLERMERALAELEKRREKAEEGLEAYRDLVKKFRRLIDAGTLKVKVVEGRLVVELATDILFPPGGATLSRAGAESIREVATVLASIPDRDFQVAGHTDDRPIATTQFPSNWHLGAARAISVTRLLVKSGLAPERVSAASHAEFIPAGTNRTKLGRAANRRIEIIIIPDLSLLPGYDELQRLGGDG